MKTESEINADILKITMRIKTAYPELYTSISEMPVTIPNVSNPEMNRKTLTDYYNSLEDLLKTYSPTHKID